MSDHIICQNFYHLASSLANTNGLLTLDFYHLANILINTNDILKIKLCHLASILTNTNDKANDFTKKRSIVSI